MKKYQKYSLKARNVTKPSCFSIFQKIVYFILLAAFSIQIPGCSSDPLLENTFETNPMILAPAFIAGVSDGRVRFREIFCAITELRGRELPDPLPCEQALAQLEGEGPPTGISVNLGESYYPLRIALVHGVGWGCVKKFIGPRGTVKEHIAQFGHDVVMLEVDPLSSSVHNATQIRDQIIKMSQLDDSKPLVLLGYSKGAPDILEAIAQYPELHNKVAAVVSVAGAIGGSPLANDAKQSTLNLFRHFPGAECELGDQGALESLKPINRKRWLAKHSLPKSIRYYSVVTFPEEQCISSLLKFTHSKLSQVDPRNDGQLIFYDQVIPSSVLLGYVNADHWAVAIPLNRSHAFIGSTFVDKNAFPREILLEAIVRYIEEDLIGT
jgi:hypothetical protein